MTTAFQSNAFQVTGFQISDGDGGGGGGSKKRREYAEPAKPKLPENVARRLRAIRGIPEPKPTPEPAQKLEGEAIKAMNAGMQPDWSMLSREWGAIMFPVVQPVNIMDVFITHVSFGVQKINDDEEAIFALLLY